MLDIYSIKSQLNEHRWIAEIICVVFGAILLSYIEAKIYKHLIFRLKKTQNLWDDAIIWSIHKPARVLIWVWAIGLVLLIAFDGTLDLELFEWIKQALVLGTIVIVAWFFLRFANFFEKRFIEKEYYNKIHVDLTTSHAFGQITRIIIFAIAIFVILEVLFDISFAGLWAIGGVGTFILGWAAKDLLANFFGAVMIYFDRPFSIGDRIRTPDRELDGFVENIGWRLTQIRNFDTRPVYIPNSVFATICLENVTKMSHRRIKETIGLRYQDSAKLKPIIESIQNMIETHPDINPDARCNASFFSFGNSSLDILVYCYTYKTEWLSYLGVKQDILFKIMEIIEDHQAEVAFQTTELKIPDGLKVFKSGKPSDD